MGDLILSEEKRGAVTIVHVDGAIDVYSAPRLREQAKAAAEAGHLVVHLRDCWLLDSTGPGVLVAALKAARETGHGLAVACADERTLKVFRTTGLTRVFRLCATVDEAVSAVTL